MKKSRVFIIISIMITLFIFSNSLKNSMESSATSGRFLSFINSILEIFSLSITHAFLRKMAHFCEFLCLGVSLSLSGLFSLKGLKITTKYILLSGLLISVTDELLQFIPVGRSPMIKDVFIDFFGILTGYMVIFIIYILNEKRHLK